MDFGNMPILTGGGCVIVLVTFALALVGVAAIILFSTGYLVWA
jgi:hypothetical protein